LAYSLLYLPGRGPAGVGRKGPGSKHHASIMKKK